MILQFLEHKNRLKELNDIKDQLNKVKSDIETLKKNRFDEFMKGFNLIGAKLKETSQVFIHSKLKIIFIIYRC